MPFKPGYFVLVLIVLLAVGLSCSDDSSEKKASKESDASDDKSDSAEDTKNSANGREKRSEEEIMFGNQQNKANGLVDDFLTMGANPNNEDKKDAKNETEEKENEDSKAEEAAKDNEEKDQNKKDLSSEISAEMPDVGSDGSELSPRWYSSSPVSSDALQYIINTHPLQSMGPSNNFVDVSGLFDQGDLYRRKRQLMSRPVSLMKRSLRSPIGQMIRTRRLPRRSMRLKRQVDVEELLAYLKNAEPNNVGNDYYKQESGKSSSFRHRDNSLLYPYGSLQNEKFSRNDEDSSESKELPDSLLFSPPSRYSDVPEYPFPSSYQTKEMDNEVPPQWMEGRISSPSIFSVSRRSSPLFYPVDYRFVPGYKKRSLVEDSNEDRETNFGKWGRVVQSPEAYASAEDVARLYALANLLAENETPERRARRSA